MHAVAHEGGLAQPFHQLIQRGQSLRQRFDLLFGTVFRLYDVEKGDGKNSVLLLLAGVMF